MKTIKKLNQFIDPNPIEAFRESAHVANETVKSNVRDSVDDLWKQLLGGGEKTPAKLSGDLSEGKEINFGKKVEQTKNINISAGIDYRGEVLHGGRRISKETEQILSRQIEEIVMELAQLVNSSTELAVQFKDVAVEQRITKPGKYHISLFQFVLGIVKQARMKVESSGACLSIAKGKKAKQDYWSMFEKQGTSFAQNNERAIATQAG